MIALMYLVAPDGHLVSPRWRWAAVRPRHRRPAVPGRDPDGGPHRVRPGRSRRPVRRRARGHAQRRVPADHGRRAAGPGLDGAAAGARAPARSVSSCAPSPSPRPWPSSGSRSSSSARRSTTAMPTWVSGVPLAVAFFLMPILFAVAVLRYRLYELDVIISRTVVVAAGAGFAAVGYTALVVLAGRQVEGRTGGLWLSLLATALVALAFQPLRRGVVRLANRAAYGERAQPYEALADFSRRLSEAPDPDALLPAVAEAASPRGLRPRRAGPPRRPRQRPGDRHVGVVGRTRRHPARRARPHRGPAARRDRGGTPPRPPPAALRPAAARGARRPDRRRVPQHLAGRLAGRPGGRARLDDRRSSPASRRRLVAADVAGRRSLEAAIARDVLPFMETLRTEIRRARTAVAAGGAGRPRAARRRHQRGARGAARAHPRRLPDPARPRRPRAGAALAGRPVGGGRLVLRRRGLAAAASRRRWSAPCGRAAPRSSARPARTRWRSSSRRLLPRWSCGSGVRSATSTSTWSPTGSPSSTARCGVGDDLLELTVPVPEQAVAAQS